MSNPAVHQLAATNEGIHRREENYMCQLFTDILNSLMEEYGISDEDMDHSLTEIKKSFHFSEGNRFSNVDYERIKNVCGYLFRYAAHGAGLVRHRVLLAINECEEFRNCLEKPVLNVISLGGGPGNDMVGFCSALYDYRRHGSLNMSVVDSIQQWKSVLDSVTYFVRQHNYGNVSRIFLDLSVNLSFIQTRLPGDEGSDESYFTSLRRADIIMIPKLLSILEFRQIDAIEAVSVIYVHIYIFSILFVQT